MSSSVVVVRYTGYYSTSSGDGHEYACETITENIRGMKDSGLNDYERHPPVEFSWKVMAQQYWRWLSLQLTFRTADTMPMVHLGDDSLSYSRKSWFQKSRTLYKRTRWRRSNYLAVF